MFDFGLSEILLIGVVALVVLGPERLPRVARTAGLLLGRLQQFVSSVKHELNGQAGLAELKQAQDDLNATARSLSADLLPPWARLPEQRTPADFGLNDEGHGWSPTTTHTTSLHRRAMQRRRQQRCRHRPRPQLRVRRHVSTQ